MVWLRETTVNVPNLVLRFALMIPLSVPNFSSIGVRIRVLWRILQSMRKEVGLVEEKKRRKKKNQTLPLVSRKWRSDFLQIWNVDSPTEPAHL